MKLLTLTGLSLFLAAATLAEDTKKTTADYLQDVSVTIVSESSCRSSMLV